MRCTKCGSNQLVTVDSRENKTRNATRRRRACLACDHRFTTMEYPIEDVRNMDEKNRETHKAVAALIAVVEKYAKEQE